MAAASKSRYYSAVDPRTLGQCQLWLDAADPNTLTLSATNVLTWKDKSAFGYDASAVGTPTFVSNKLNGYGGVFFSTTGGWMIGNASNTGTTVTGFVVADMSSNAMNDARIVSLGTVGSQDFDSALRTSFIIRNGSTAQIRSFRNSATLGAVDICYNQPFIGTSLFTGTSNTVFRNGTSGTTIASSGTFGYSNYGLGRDPGLATGRHVGHIYEVILYSESLNFDTQRAIEGYLGWKWGIGAGPTLDPRDIPNIALWLDGADQPSITLSGSNVTQWNDKSGRGCNATQVTSARQPTYDSITKRLNFTRASSQYLNLPDSTLPAGNTSYAYFAVVTFRQTIDGMGIIGGGSYGTNNGVFAFRSLTNAGLWTYWWNNDFGTGTNVYTINSNTLVETTYQSGGSRFTYVNSVQQASNVPSGARNQGISNNAIGVTYLVGNEYLDGSIREVLVYSNVLEPEQRNRVENYLMKKWNIANGVSVPNQFPNIFPFATTRPFLRPFVPADVTSNCQVWVDAADPTTIDVCQTTLTVQAIRPKGVFGTSTTTCNLSNATGFSWNENVFNGNYPAFYQGGSARTSNDLGVNTSLSIAQPMTVHFVCDKINVDPGYGYIMDSTNSGARVAIFSHNFALFAGLSIGQTADTSLTVPSIGGAVVSNTASQTYYNGILKASGSTSNQALSGLTLANRFSVDQGWDGHLSEFIIHNGVLSSNDRQRIEGYLAWKWGLRDKLSSTHPYYLYPPLTVAFNPNVISNCFFWLDAADRTTIDVSGEAPNVVYWRDKSGNNRSFSNTSVSTRPVYVNNDIQSYMEFNGTNQFLEIASGSAPTFNSFTSFIVEQRTSNKTSNYFVGTNVATAASNSGFGYLTNTSVNFQHSNTTSTTVVPSYESDGNMRVWSFARVSGGSRSNIENGTIRTISSATTNTATQTTFIGRYSNSYYAGRIYEILWYSRILASNERMQLEGYLAHKWGRDGSFNVVHPYRLVKP
jgi:hypothetical protein